MSAAHACAKAVFDRVASLAGIVMLSPLLLVLAVLVKAGDGGRVLFSQERVGRGGRPFRIYKFRSMRDSPAEELQVTASGDSRITPVGKFLRRTKLDELPQLFNVLRGEMSLVGPRPEVPRYVRLYTEEQREVLAVRPGLTDWATLQYRNEEALLAGRENPEEFYIGEIMPEKLRLSREYLERATFFSDFGILWLTFLRIAGIGESGGGKGAGSL